MKGGPSNGDGAGSNGRHEDWFAEESDRSSGGLLVGWIEESPAGRDELTMFPADAPDEKRVVAWMTANEGSYVDLDEMR